MYVQAPVLPEMIGDVMGIILVAMAITAFVTVFIVLSCGDKLKIYVRHGGDEVSEKRGYGHGLGLAGGLFGSVCALVAFLITAGLLPDLINDGFFVLWALLGAALVFGPLMTLSVIWVKECRALVKEYRVRYPNASQYRTRETYLNPRG